MAGSEEADRYTLLQNLLYKCKSYTEFLIQRMNFQKRIVELKAEQKKLSRKDGTDVLDASALVPEEIEHTDSHATPSFLKMDNPSAEQVASIVRTKQVKVRKSRKELIEQKYALPTRINEFFVPAGQPVFFSGTALRPYQMDGVLWLQCLYENGVNCILGDEMGLGKTVQCAAFIAELLLQGVVGPFLVIAPLSTLNNWFSEFKRFAPKIPVLIYHGTKPERQEKYEQISEQVEVVQGLSCYPVVITSYELAMRERCALAKFDWRLMIVDEGHRVKDSNCRLIRELRKYEVAHRILLTGTPLQNNMAELWSLLNFLMPNIFDNLGIFENTLNIREMDESSIDEDLVAEEREEQIITSMHQILRPFLLRRLKCDVELVIPPKKEILVQCPLTNRQRSFYLALINRTINNTKSNNCNKKTIITECDIDTGDISTKSPDVKKAKSSSIASRLRRRGKRVAYADIDDFTSESETENSPKQRKAQPTVKLRNNKQPLKAITNSSSHADVSNSSAVLSVRMTNVLMQLRKVCNHPYLLELPLDSNGDYIAHSEIVSTSGKMLVLDQLLLSLKFRSHKVLLFSQMTRMLDIFEDYCQWRGFAYCRLDGTMSLTNRQEQITDFSGKDDVFLFLLSTRAGGLGVNLIAADTVVIYDSDWNPQCDLQAQDRCHRIGQTRPVIVYRLCTTGTIDEKIVNKAVAKRKLEKMIIHKDRFNTTDLRSTEIALSLVELLDLLRSTDTCIRGVEPESDGNNNHGSALNIGKVISEEHLEMLLDRSDLIEKWNEVMAKEALKRAVELEEKQNEDSQRLRRQSASPNQAVPSSPPTLLDVAQCTSKSSKNSPSVPVVNTEGVFSVVGETETKISFTGSDLLKHELARGVATYK